MKLVTSVSVAALLANLAAPALATTNYNSNYDASSGLLPTNVCPPWQWSANIPNAPVVGGGVLTISTDTYIQDSGYVQSGPDLKFSPTWVMEARVRLVSGGHNLDSRGPINIAFSPMADVGNVLIIRHGEIFLNIANLTKGPSAFVDTGSFHTYRIELTGSSILVFYDGVLELTGPTYSSHDDFGNGPIIGFGDFTGYGYGVSEWQYFHHNASSQNCPVPAQATTWSSVKDLYR